MDQAKLTSEGRIRFLIDEANYTLRLGAQMTGGTFGPSNGISSAINPPITAFAGGGNFNAWQPFIMSEAGTAETLNMGAQDYLVGAKALVLPMESGSVTPGGGKSVVFGDGAFRISISGVKDEQKAVNLAIMQLRQEIQNIGETLSS